VKCGVIAMAAHHRRNRQKQIFVGAELVGDGRRDAPCNITRCASF
jgi:hypothetical protein